jgi:hypothetical protein
MMTMTTVARRSSASGRLRLLLYISESNLED